MTKQLKSIKLYVMNANHLTFAIYWAFSLLSIRKDKCRKKQVIQWFQWWTFRKCLLNPISEYSRLSQLTWCTHCTKIQRLEEYWGEQKKSWYLIDLFLGSPAGANLQFLKPTGWKLSTLEYFLHVKKIIFL